jgi:hypothetical protein
MAKPGIDAGSRFGEAAALALGCERECRVRPVSILPSALQSLLDAPFRRKSPKLASLGAFTETVGDGPTSYHFAV